MFQSVAPASPLGRRRLNRHVQFFTTLEMKTSGKGGSSAAPTEDFHDKAWGYQKAICRRIG
jgi:hypothetical protein